MDIKKVKLQTGKLRELKEFYLNTLGFKCFSENDKSFTVIAGSSLLTFEQGNGNAFYHFAFNISENMIVQSLEWIQAKAEPMTYNGENIIDFRSWDAHSIYFYDPAGNIIEFIARHRLENASNGEFSFNNITSISEIGMPVKNVEEFFKEINEATGIPLFSGDNESFTAAGDDNGLLIIVPEGRNWFPNCPPAKIYPITLELSGIKDSALAFGDYRYTIKSISD